MKIRTALSPLAGAALAGALLLPAPAHAAETYVSSNPRSATMSTGPVVTLSRYTVPAGRWLVSATVSARSAPGSNPHLMLAGLLTCGARRAVAGINLTSGEGVVIPRMIVSTGGTTCSVSAQSALGYSRGDHLLVSAVWTVTPVEWSSTGGNALGQATVTAAGDAVDAAPVTRAIPVGPSYANVRADVRVTTCTVTGGSRENGGGYLCTGGHLDLGGTVVRVQIIAQQFASQGSGYCATTIMSDRLLTIDRWLHHEDVYFTGKYYLQTSYGCGRSVRVKIRLTIVSGASLVTHANGTATDIYR